MLKKCVNIQEQKNLDEFVDYLIERENSNATIQKYQTDIRTFFKYLDDDYLIDKQRILEYKEWLQEHYASSSANSMIAALNQFLEFLGVSNMKIKRIKVQKKLMQEEARNLTKEEYEILRDTAWETGETSLAMIMETIAATGIRISELSFFTVKMVERGVVEIHNKGKQRIILIPSPLRKKLLYYIKKKNIFKGSVFVTKNGNPYNRSNIWKKMKKVCKYAGVSEKKVFPHNLRHLFARMYYQYNKDLTGLADIMGHSSVEITRIYTTDVGLEYRNRMERLDFLSNKNLL